MSPVDSASGQGPATSAGPGETQANTPTRKPTDGPGRRAPRWALILITAGALVTVATYLVVLLAHPATLQQDLGTATLWVMVGYLAGAALIAGGALPLVPPSIYALVPVAIALNIVIGHVVGNLTPIPLYLDALGSVMIGVMAGPAAGALTGVLTNVIWGLTLDPSTIAFTAGAAFVGAAAGWAARLGAFKKPWWAVLAGLIVGVPAAALGAPVAAFVYGGGLGVGTGGVVATLQAAGLEMLNATIAQSLISDTIDKALIFLLAFFVFRGLPRRIVGRYAFARRSLPSRR